MRTGRSLITEAKVGRRNAPFPFHRQKRWSGAAAGQLGWSESHKHDSRQRQQAEPQTGNHDSNSLTKHLNSFPPVMMTVHTTMKDLTRFLAASHKLLSLIFGVTFNCLRTTSYTNSDLLRAADGNLRHVTNTVTAGCVAVYRTVRHGTCFKGK